MATLLDMLNITPDKRDAILASTLAAIAGGDDVVQALHERSQGYSLRAIARHAGIAHPSMRLKLIRANIRLRHVLRPHGIELPWDSPTMAQERAEPEPIIGTVE